MNIYRNTTKRLRCQQHVLVFGETTIVALQTTVYFLEVVFMIRAINQDLKIFGFFGTFRRGCAASLAS